MTAQSAYDAMATSTSGSPLLNNVVLVAATMTTGLSTGVFFLYATTIMPGLRHTDDKTFVGAFQSMDRAIYNPWFMTAFFGALILIGLSAVLQLGADTRKALPWLIAAFVLYFIGIVITMAVNVPLNDALRAAGDPDHISNLAKVRQDFNEARWSAWHIVRTLTSTAAFGIITTVAVVYSRLR